MIVVALDLGRTSGIAWGRAGSAPLSATLILKRSDEPRGVAFSNLLEYLSNHFERQKPNLVVKEAALPLAAMAKLGSGEDVAWMVHGLAAIVEAACVRFGIRHEEVSDSTWRKHFVGVGRGGDRATSKQLSLERCWQLGYLDRDVAQIDRAEALGIWDFASAHYGRAAPAALAMFPPAVERRRK